MFSGFDTITLDVQGATLHARVGGNGPPLLLMHGYPQTHVMWHVIADDLAKTHRVIIPDLRGYGASVCHDGDLTFRAMARDHVSLMAHLGFHEFNVIAHDRGARAAHRMVLDHPNTVTSLALLDILPTLDVWRTMDAWLAQRYYHWMFLSQPGDVAQTLINGHPAMFLRSALKGLSGHLDTFAPHALTAYETAAQNPSVVAAWCADYTAGATVDLDHDRFDLGRTSDTPCLILWGSRGVVAHHENPVTVWQNWFPAATGNAIDAGHFLVEEKPEEVLSVLLAHLSAQNRRQAS